MSEVIQVGPFRLFEQLGAGAMGEVWRGVHLTQQAEVAVKVVTAALASEERYRHRFQREVEAMAGLNHAGIVRPLDYGEVDSGAEGASGGRLVKGSPWVAMELARGGGLEASRLQSWVEVRVVTLQILSALGHAHARGLVHRDLKPENVLLRGKGEALDTILTDFGISHPMEVREVHKTGQIESRVAGTPAYMAPEQFEGRWRDYGPWTDLYALGCMVWELCCGARPFTGETLWELCKKHLADPLPSLAPRFPVPVGLEGWLARLTQKLPSARLRCAADAAWALEGLGGLLSSPSPLGGWEVGAAGRAETVASVASAATMTQAEVAPAPALGWGEVAPVAVGLGSAGAREVPPLPVTWVSSEEASAPAALAGVGLGLFEFREAALVGRERERDAIWAALASVHATRRPTALVIQGEAGLGASRLAEWMAQRALEVGGAVVWRAPHNSIAAMGHGLARMLELALGCGWLDRGRAFARIVDLLIWGGAAEAVARPLAAAVVELIRPGGEGGGVPAVRFGGLRERLFTVERLMRLASLERPLLVVLDDVQWGVEATALVRHVMSRGESGFPVCFLMTAQTEAMAGRPEEARALAEVLALPGVAGLQVGALAAPELRQLLRQQLQLAPELEGEILARTAGNPLFASQLLASWVQRRLLVPTPEGFALRRGAPRELPASLVELWEARLDDALSLASRASLVRASLELAASLGDPVDGMEWTAAQAEAGCVLTASEVNLLAARGLLREGEQGWMFCHGLLREALERSSREAGRWEGLHLCCASMLAGLYGPRTAGIAERRALHLLEAGASVEAQEPLLAAVRECSRGGRLDRARQLLAMAEEAASGTLPPSDPRRVEALGLRARLLRGAGELEAAVAASNQMLQLAAEGGLAELAMLALKERGMSAQVAGDLERAARCLEQARQLAEQQGSVAELGAILLEVARVQADQGLRGEASRTLALARARCEEAGDVLQAGHCLWLAAELLNGAGAQEQARRFSEEALAIFERLGARVAQSYALNMIAEVDRLAGRLGEARARYGQALVLAEETGQVQGVYFLRLNLGLIDLQEGSYGPAEAAFAAVLPFFERHKMVSAVVTARCALLPCQAARGELAEVDAGFDALSEALSQQPWVHYDLGLGLERAGEVLAARGAVEAAERAWCLALGQWSGLGNAARVAEVQGSLERLMEQGAER